MTDHPPIDPHDVREGDTVIARFDDAQWPAVIEGVVHPSLSDDDDRLYIGGYVVTGSTDMRLVARPFYNNPALRAGDWVRTLSGREGQITSISGLTVYFGVQGWMVDIDKAERIEPPLGWPVEIRDGDGTTLWYVKFADEKGYWCSLANAHKMTWEALVLAGGTPAQVVSR